MKYFANRQKLGLKASNLPAILFGGLARHMFGGFTRHMFGGQFRIFYPHLAD